MTDMSTLTKPWFSVWKLDDTPRGARTFLVQSFSHSVMSDFSWPNGLQHATLTGPSLIPDACSKCPSLKLTWTGPRHYLKTKKWVVPRLLDWSSHLLACEITELTKPYHTTFHDCSIHPLWWHTLCGLCFSLNPNKSTSYLSLCLWLIFFFFFSIRHQESELH